MITRSIILEVQRVICIRFGLMGSEMISPRRGKNRVSGPRQMAMAMAREVSDLSLTTIGNHFGGRDHTTVMHAIEKVQERRLDKDYDDAYREVLADVENRTKAVFIRREDTPGPVFKTCRKGADAT